MIEKDICEAKVTMGFDFGLRSIGVAVGQPITKSATPIKAILARNGIPNWKDIDDVVNLWKPRQFVVGLPKTINDEDLFITDYVKIFAEELSKHYNSKVYFADERFTTTSAKEELFRQGGFRKLQKGIIDSYSAKIILENWFNSNC